MSRACTLWAVRVLDAWCAQKDGREWLHTRRQGDDMSMCQAADNGAVRARLAAHSRDTARCAVAEQLARELPHEVLADIERECSKI